MAIRRMTGLRTRVSSFFAMLVAGGVAMAGGSVAANAAEQVKVRANLAQEALVRGKTQKTFIKISLEGLKITDEMDRTPVNVALVMDRSGSMRGQKLAQAKEAALMGLNRLTRDDIGGLVVFDTKVDVIVPSTRMSDDHSYQSKIRNLRAGGSTALYAGVRKGVQELEKFLERERVNRVILLSDGMANIGPSTPAELGALGRKLAQKGIAVSTIGLGLGYNEDLMTKLAFNSDGNHAFVESPRDLVKIFDQEFGDVLSVVAQEVEIEIIFKPGFRPLRSIGREAQVRKDRATFRLNQLYGSQEKEAVLELEVDGSKAVDTAQIADVKIRYLNMGTKKRDEVSRQVDVRFTDSKEEAEKSLNKDVMVSVTSQIAVERNEMAVKLRDEGKVQAAKKMLDDNAAYIRMQSDRVGGSDALGALESSNKEDAQAVSGANWNRSRKLMRAKQYKSKTKQSY